METNKEEKDIMDAQQILNELQKLADSERAEKEPGSEADASLLDDAIGSLQKFVDAEEKEEPANESEAMPEKAEGVVDTGVLNGPIGGLKNFLIRTQRDNEGQ